MSKKKFVKYSLFKEYPVSEMIEKSKTFYSEIKRRRTIRDFSSKEIPEEIIINAVKSAGTAPSGANMQPWHFVVVKNNEIKKQIRIAAETEEKEFYLKRASKEWLDALAPLGTDENKPFLETAPYLIVIFSKKYDLSSGRN